MTTDHDDPSESDLETLFAEARALRPVPSADLMTRLLADAERERPRPALVYAPVRGGWRDWIAALGGWPALGSLAGAAAAGVWIGAAPPVGLSTLLPTLWGEGVSVAVGADEDPLSWLEG